MKKLIRISAIILTVCLILLFIKNQYSWILLQNSTYGMPALTKRGTIENLYLGSSMFRQGIDINVLEQNPKSDDYILAYNGNQPVLEYLELKHLLDHNVRIQNLYVDMYVYSAWNKPGISDEKMFMELNMIEKWNLWTLTQSDPFGSDLESFWRMWVNSNNELIITWPISSPIINSQFHNGGTLTITSHASKEALSEIPATKIEDNMNPVQEHYIIELISLARANDINICFLETPKYKTIANDPSYLAAMQQYAQLLDNEQVSYILCESSWQSLGSPEHACYYSFDTGEETCYADPFHLSSYGRCKFTEAVITMNTLPNRL